MNDSALNNSGVTRREFVRTTVAAGLVLGATPGTWAAETGRSEVHVRTLGRTGQCNSANGLGGYHIGVPPEDEGLSIIRKAIDSGITFMDNSWDYHNGGSELRMGKALRDGYRDKVFLMTKIDGRTKASVAKQ